MSGRCVRLDANDIWVPWSNDIIHDQATCESYNKCEVYAMLYCFKLN